MLSTFAAANSVYSVLLMFHVGAGIMALFSMCVAIYTKLIRNQHRLHVLSGRIFGFGMAGVFITTVPLTLLRPNVFLLAIGIFSFYMTFHGWRMAVNRKGKPGFWDKRGAEIMLVTAVFMLVSGAYRAYSGDENGITLAVFGGIGGFLAGQNLRAFRQNAFKGKERISSHLASMLGAGIAAITAALVTNVQTEPVWLAWLAPTLVLTPVIIYALRRHRAGRLPKAKHQA